MADIDAATRLVHNGHSQSLVRLTGILDLQGRTVRQLDMPLPAKASARLDIDGLGAGVYLLQYEVAGLGVQALRFIRF